MAPKGRDLAGKEELDFTLILLDSYCEMGKLFSDDDNHNDMLSFITLAIQRYLLTHES